MSCDRDTRRKKVHQRYMKHCCFFFGGGGVIVFISGFQFPRWTAPCSLLFAPAPCSLLPALDLDLSLALILAFALALDPSLALVLAPALVLKIK